MKIFVLLFFLLAVHGDHALANDYIEAREVLREALHEMLEKMESKPAVLADKAQEDQFYYDVAKSVLDIVDIEIMSRLVLGKHWASADATQKRQFVAAFEKMLIQSYARQTALLPNVQVEFLPPPAAPPQRKYQIIRTHVKAANNKPPLQVNYTMTRRDGWKAFDFIVDGVSILKQFRQNFDAEIRETSLQALISRLNAAHQPERAEGTQ